MEMPFQEIKQSCGNLMFTPVMPTRQMYMKIPNLPR